MAAWRRASLRLPGANFGKSWGNGTPHWWGLVGLCASLNLVETALVAALGDGAHPDLAPQASAMPPFGVFGDLRWISVYHDSWAALAGEVVAMLAARGLLTAVSIRLAWPVHLSRPTWAQLLRRGTFATALASLLLWPSVALLYGLAAVPVSWLFLAAVPTALLVAFIVHPAAVSSDWWRRATAPRALWWVGVAFLTLSASSGAMAASPLAAWPLIALLSGLFNAWSWVGLVHAVADRRPSRHFVPVAALSTLALAGLVVGGAVAGFEAAREAAASSSATHASPAVGSLGGPGRLGPRAVRRPPGTRASSQERRGGHASGAVLIVSGYGSSWGGGESHPFPGNFIEQRFSYRGLSASGQPLSYTSADTAKPLTELDNMFLHQVKTLYKETGLRVDVVAESEGALVAKTALLAEPTRAVGTLVLASPLEDPGRVWYPPKGAEGWGVASDEAMQLISDAFQGVSPIDLSPNNPLFASLDDQAPALGEAMACPLSGVRQWALLPLADATVTPFADRASFPEIVLPAFHGGLIETTAGEEIVSRILKGRPVSASQFLALAEKAISYASSAWQVPSLAASDYPNGHEPGGCEAIAGQLRSAIAHAGGHN
jgi:hypothetical protein